MGFWRSTVSLFIVSIWLLSSPGCSQKQSASDFQPKSDKKRTPPGITPGRIASGYGADKTDSAKARGTPDSAKNSNKRNKQAAKQNKAYDGLYTDFAPTRSSITRVPESEIYPSSPVMALEYMDIVKKMHYRNIDKFVENHAKNKESADEAAALMREIVNSGYDPISKTARTALFEKARKYLKRPEFKDDPLLKLQVARIGAFSGHFAESYPLALIAIEEFRNSNYPAFAVNDAFGISAIAKSGTDQAAVPMGSEERCDALIYWVTNDLHERGNELRLVYAKLSDFIENCEDQKMIEAMVGKLTTDDRVPAWLQAMIKGKFLNTQAWKVRGLGMADSVSTTHAAKFRELQKQSAGYFKKAISICPHFPEAPCAMIDIARAGSDELDFEEWFKKTTAVQFDYLPAYEEKLFSLLPIWHGNSDAMLKFGEDCIATSRFDTMVPYFYFMCVKKIGSDARDTSQEDYRKLFASQAVNDNMLKVVDAMLAGNKAIYFGYEQITPELLRSLKYVILTRANRDQEARVVFDSLDDGLESRAKTYFNVNTPDRMTRSFSLIASGEYAAEYSEIERLLVEDKNTTKNYAKILEIARPICEDLKGSIEELGFQRIVQTIENRLAFDAGKKVALKFDPDFMIWQGTTKETHHFESETSFILDNTKGDGHAELLSAFFGGPKSVEVSIESLGDSFNKQPAIALQALRLHDPGIRGSRDYHMVEISMMPRQQVAFGSTLWGPNFFFSVPGPKPIKRLRMNVAEGYFEVFVDNVFVMRGRSRNFSFENFFRILRPTQVDYRGTFRISDITIQKWNDVPPPISEGPQKMVDHYTQVLQKHPDDGWALHFRALAKILLNDLDGALPDLEKSGKNGVPVALNDFYFGHIYDLKADKSKAKEYYRKCSESGEYNETSLAPYTDGTKFVIKRVSPRSAAHFRYKWLLMTERPNFDLKQLKNPNSDFHPGPLWMEKFINAQQLALLGRCAEAKTSLEQFINEVPLEMEDEFKKILAAYRSNKSFIQDQKTIPFYMFADLSPLFFWDLESRIPELKDALN
jgi:hypothetical protein